MDFLGRLLVQIVGDNAQLDASIQQSGARLNRFARDVGGTGRTITDQLGRPITSLDGAVRQLDGAVSSLDGEMSGLDSTASQLSTPLRDADNAASNLDSSVSDLDNSVSDLDNSITDLDDAARAADGPIDQLDNSVDDLGDSSNNTSNRIRELSQSAMSIGRTLTTTVTAPITLAAGAAARLAIQAQETNSAFNTSFRGIEDAADSAAQNLQNNFGLSRLESERLLQSTGDLLRGFGATQQEALDTSVRVQELAVDLASFRNVQGVRSARARR